MTHVIKFGGSCLGNAYSIKRVCKLIKNQKDPAVCVVSGMYGITNKLIKAGIYASQGNTKYKSIGNDIHHFYKREIDELLNNNNNKKKEFAYDYINQNMIEFDNICSSLLNNSCMKKNDELISLGELFSSKIISLYLNCDKYKSALIRPEEIIITNGIYGNATPNIKQSKKKINNIINPLLDNNNIIVVPGFIGKGNKINERVTLGRGGSDVTATIIANALNADNLSLYKVENTTDNNDFMIDWVNGLSGIVHLHTDEKQTISTMSYEVASELAYFGRNVLHPQCMDYVMDTNININTKIRNILNNNKYTRINKKYKREEQVNTITVSSVKHSNINDEYNIFFEKIDKFSVISLIGDDIGYSDIVRNTIQNILSDLKLMYCMNIDKEKRQNSISVVLQQKNTTTAIEKLHELLIVDKNYIFRI